MKQPYHVVIVGAGVVGLTMAALLASCRQREQLKITVIDAHARAAHAADDDIGLRVSSIATGSTDLLSEIGAWPAELASRACAYDHMSVWDEASSVDSGDALHFAAAEFAVPQLGFIVGNAALLDALLTVVDRHTIATIFAAPITALEAGKNGQQVVLEDGRKIAADLVIGADGARSVVRDCAGIDCDAWTYDQAAFVTHLQPEKAHRNIARQRFLAAGPLGMLPLRDGRISVVWSTTEAQAQWAMAAADDELGATLTDASDHVLGRLGVAGPRGVFALRARHAKEYVKSGIALVGDAAHAVHPLAGQGANLGLQDAAMLAEVISAALAAGEHPGDRPVLRRYERARKGANASMLHLITGLNRLFATDSALLKELRMVGMRLFNHSGPIRERVVQVALGTRR